MNIKLISRYLGVTLIFNGAFMLLSMVVSILNGMDSSFSPLLISGFITTIVGIFPLIFVRQSEDIRLSEGFAITILAWCLSCIFGMLPYLLWGGEFTLANAFFESVSGFTTTGATILNDIEALPKGLIFWRSSTHFIGGVGVVVFTLLVLPTMSTFRFKMTKMEISSLSKENYRFRTKELIRIILSVYLCITIFTHVALCLAGMPAFDAINHAFSIVATGGFSTRNASIMAYDSFPIEMVVTCFTLISGLHFGLLYSLFVSHSTKIFKSPVIRFFLLSIVISTLSISFNLVHSDMAENWIEALRMALFQVVTISTTTGFATADTSVWPTFSILILLYLSIQGACSGSTTGGLKVDRIWILIQTIKVQMTKLLHPTSVVQIKVGNRRIDSDLSLSVSAFVALYFFMIIIGAIVISAWGLDFMDSFTSSVSMTANVGPAFGSCGSLENYSHFPGVVKVFLSLQMLLGRLEIYPLLMILSIFRVRRG